MTNSEIEWFMVDEEHEKYFTTSNEKVLFIGCNADKTMFTVCFENSRTLKIKKFRGKGCIIFDSMLKTRQYLNQHARDKGLRECKCK